jgi:hypothetical protein
MDCYQSSKAQAYPLDWNACETKDSVRVGPLMRANKTAKAGAGGRKKRARKTKARPDVFDRLSPPPAAQPQVENEPQRRRCGVRFRATKLIPSTYLKRLSLFVRLFKTVPRAIKMFTCKHFALGFYG